MQMRMQTRHRFNLVHDCQRMFRLMLAALSNPGRWLDFSDLAECFDSFGLWLPVALTLCDLETHFALVGCSEDLSREISFLTGSRAVSLEEADFVFVGHSSDPGSILQRVRYGSYQDPQKAATVFGLTNPIQGGEELLSLSGPGIAGSHASFSLPLEASRWMRSRASLGLEYPLGIDLFIIDPKARLLGIPRTTKLGR